MNEIQNQILGFITLAESYQECASVLVSQLKDASLQLRHDAPIDNLYAHSLELYLKGALLAYGRNETDLRNFGHNLLAIYDTLRSEIGSKELVADLEGTIRKNWEIYLRSERDKYSAVFEQQGMVSNEALQENGVLNDDEIAQELPNLRDQVVWISERHSKRGGVFRYHQTRLDYRMKVKAFGLDEDIVWRTANYLGKETNARLLKFIT